MKLALPFWKSKNVNSASGYLRFLVHFFHIILEASQEKENLFYDVSRLIKFRSQFEKNKILLTPFLEN